MRFCSARPLHKWPRLCYDKRETGQFIPTRSKIEVFVQMSDILDTLRQEGVDPALLTAVQEYRAAHPLEQALRPRIPAPAFTYYGKEVWEQALAAILCGENLLLAGGKATGKNVLAENLAAALERRPEIKRVVKCRCRVPQR